MSKHNIKRISALLCAMFMLFSTVVTASAADIDPYYSTTRYTVVETTGLYGTAQVVESNRLTTVSKGSNVTLMAKIDSNWLQVKYGSYTGYIQRAYTYLSVNCYKVSSSTRIPLYSDTSMTYAICYLNPGAYVFSSEISLSGDLMRVKVLNGSVGNFDGTWGYVSTGFLSDT